MPTRIVNAATVALVKNWEGLVLTAADDGYGNLTIGYGHTGPDVTRGETITEAQADTLLASDLAGASDEVTAKTPGANLNDNQFGAIVAMVFNSGESDLDGTNLQKYLINGDYAAASADILNFDIVNGVPNTGVENRCDAEQTLFNTPDEAPTSTGWIVVEGKTQIAAQLFGDSAFAPLRPLCNALYGEETQTLLGWDSASQSPSWNGVSMGVPCRQLGDGTAWAEVRPFAAWAECNIAVDGETITLSH